MLLRATGFAGRSLMVAALFAAHPINVGSVVWISERKTVLSMLFFLLALGAYRWYVSKPGVVRYAVIAVLFALGLMAKPQVITFPFVLLLWDYWPLQRVSFRSGKSAPAAAAARLPQKRWRSLIEEKLPLFGIAAASAVMTAVIAHPFSRSTGPKSAGGINGPGLITGTERAAVGDSVAGAVTRPIVGCAE